MCAVAASAETATDAETRAGCAGFRPSITWIGDGRRPEFAAALAALRCHADVTTAIDIDSIAGDIASNECAGIVIAQAFAGQLRTSRLAALSRRFPTAPVIVIVGNLVEGERRSGDPLTSALRIPWSQAATILDRELSKLRSGACPSWGFGETLTDDERDAMSAPLPGTALPGAAGKQLPENTTFAVCADDPAIAAWLVELTGSWNATISSGRSSPSPRAVLWAAPSHDIEAQCRLQLLAVQYPGVPILALAHFPRPHLLETWRRLGVADYCALPVEDDVLLRKLTAVIEPSQDSTKPILQRH